MRVFTDLSEVKNVWFGHRRNIGQRRPCSVVGSFVLVNKFVYLNKKLKIVLKIYEYILIISMLRNFELRQYLTEKILPFLLKTFHLII